MFYNVWVIWRSLVVFFSFLGGLGFLRLVSICFMFFKLVRDLVFMLSVMCCVVLKRLVKVGVENLLGVLNSRVGLFVFSIMLLRVVIFSSGEIFLCMCLSLFRFLRLVMKFCRLLYFIIESSLEEGK